MHWRDGQPTKTIGKLNAFEMWTYQRMFCISYTDRNTLEEMAGEKRKSVCNIKERKIQCFGHIIRANGRRIQLLEWKIDGKRRREGSRGENG